MSVELWLIRDEAWTVFDWKPVAACMEQEWDEFCGKKVNLTEEAYADFIRVQNEYRAWQDKLANMLDND
jgi:hypothetical protein